MKITISNKLHLTQMPEQLRSELAAQLQFLNPKWVENDRMGRWNRHTPKILKYYHQTSQWWIDRAAWVYAPAAVDQPQA